MFFGTGNPGPDYYSANREGDNLFTASIVALDADTGKLKWHYQFTPHDVHDWDATQVPVLGELPIEGKPRKVVMFANRNGFFYTIDRATGKLIVAKPFVETTWAKEISSITGRPILLPNNHPNEQGTKTCPDLGGGTNFMSPSYDPTLRLFFVTARETCATYFAFDQEFKVGVQYMAGGTVRPRDQRNWGALRAIDPVTAERKWEFRYPTTSASGVLSTASGLVFAGDGDGNLMAFDSRTGKNLWHYQLGAAAALDVWDDVHGRREAVLARTGREHADGVCVALDRAEGTQGTGPQGKRAQRVFRLKAEATRRGSHATLARNLQITLSPFELLCVPLSL